MARWGRRLILATLVGMLAGLAAAALDVAIHYGADRLVGQFRHVGDAEILRFDLAVLLLPALGGLISGIVVMLLARKSTGQGTDIMTHAFHRRLGALEMQGPSVKAGCAAVVISCGGSAGPEGPISALGAAIGSTLGKWFRVTPHDRRVLLVAGCAAGVGSIFRCPLGGALFACGVLYSDVEYESDAIVPSVIASVVGYSLYTTLLGFGEPLLRGVAALRFNSAWELLPYAVLGPLCGLVCLLFHRCMRVVEQTTVKLHLRPWFAPMLGGLLTGAMACLIPQVMDWRYLFIQNSLDFNWLLTGDTQRSAWGWALFFLAVIIAKCVATGFTLGSGASGGVLGPAVFLGGVTGAFLGCLCQAMFPDHFPEHLRAAMIPVGMAGVLAAAMRTPLAAMIMVAEMTGGYGLIVPLMLVSITSYLLGRRWGLNHEQVRAAADSPAHAADTVIHMLENWRVDEFMTPKPPPAVPLDMTVGDLLARLQPGETPLFMVMRDNEVMGVISAHELSGMAQTPELNDVVIAADVMSPRPPAVYGDDNLYELLNIMHQMNIDVVPVVSHKEEGRYIGFIHQERVTEALNKYLENTQQALIHEHAGLGAIRRDQQVQQLLGTMAPTQQQLVQRLLVPMQAVGMSLRQADLRKQFGVHVIAIEQPDGSVQCPPDIDAPLSTKQRLVAIVSK